MDIFVGSLSFKLKESELREAFEKYGEVTSVKIITDKITRQSKGFGFIEMPNEDEAHFAINSLNGAEMYGRPLVVNESQKKDARPARPDTPPAPRVDRYASKKEDSPETPSASGQRTFRNSDKPSSDNNRGSHGYGNDFGGGKSRDFGRDKHSSKNDPKKGKKVDYRKNRDDDDDWY